MPSPPFAHEREGSAHVVKGLEKLGAHDRISVLFVSHGTPAPPDNYVSTAGGGQRGVASNVLPRLGRGRVAPHVEETGLNLNVYACRGLGFRRAIAAPVTS